MIRILLCCGGGFSSSALAKAVEKQIIEEGMEDQVSITFLPLTLFAAQVKKNEPLIYDAVLCCPHLLHSVNRLTQSFTIRIPVHILPPRLYGLMTIREILYDVQDMIERFSVHQKNPFFFPHEEDILRVTRSKSYRNTYKQEAKD